VLTPIFKDMEQLTGWKRLPEQYCSYPFIGPLHFGDKKDLILRDQGRELETLEDYLSRNQYKYQQFLRQKGRFPSLDVYACFQPFNECFKALFPFVDYIREQLKPGDTVLNLWDRSGWTASMLGAWFPEQHIITVWEGDKDILGYKGFHYWMNRERRENHTVLFADFLRPFPLESNSVSAIVGMDLLHRFNQPDLLAEIHRIAKPMAPILFPHVHLTNNEPEPYFDRGCRQLHGSDYDFLFHQLEPLTNRRGFVLSEPASFNWNDRGTDKEKELISEPNHSDYNACVAWLPSDHQPVLKPWRGHEQQNREDSYLLQNPFLQVNTLTHQLELNTKTYGPLIDELLERHSVYQRRIQESIGRTVDDLTREILYWAGLGYTIKEIRQKTNTPKAVMQPFLESVFQLELAQVVPVDETGFRLQTLLGHQSYLLERKEEHLAAHWKKAVAFYGDALWVKSGDDTISFNQADELITLIQKAFLQEGLRKGDKILLCADLHPEVLLLFWAAVSLGIIIVPVSPKESAMRIQEHFHLIQPAMAFTDPQIHAAIEHTEACKIIMTDLVNDPAYEPGFSFETWLSANSENELEPATSNDRKDIAVILWTTGSTGNPKGIPLTHAQLIRSGRLMTETYSWKKTDRYFALGGLETMSGLRQATVCIAESGACCVIPEKGKDLHQLNQSILLENITILTANPSFFKQFLLSARGEHQFSPLHHSIRLALCTGNALPADLRTKWQNQTGTTLLNYYGLTETSGICIAESPGFSPQDEYSIGLPVGCLIKIISESGNEVTAGTKGELCIYGAGIFSGYFQNEEATKNSLHNGWFHTKDLAVQHEDGSLSLYGRLSDIIKLPSGERIELMALEEVLVQIPGLADWALCPLQEKEKESIALFVVCAENSPSSGIIHTIKKQITRSIGAYAVPLLIEKVTRIPRGNHNKVLRKQLLDHYFNS
jgi:acyl-coenzyme A synthetase/AMP-(fatty) acid ligase